MKTRTEGAPGRLCGSAPVSRLGARAGALASALLAAALLGGCGAQVDGAGGQSGDRTGEGTAGSGGEVTVGRCGEKVRYPVPRNAVAYEGGSADKLFSLGLTEHVRGYVMPPANPPVSGSPWASEYAEVPKLSEDLLNKEVVVEAGADFVVAGWESGFSEQRGITPEILDKLGVHSFMHSESCFNYPGHPERTAPFEGLYTDLERLGRIFRVEERAARLVQRLKKRVAAVESEARRGERPPVFLYDSGTDRPATAGNQVPPDEIIERAGGRNIFHGLDQRWTEASWEAVAEARPEVVVILDYGDKPAAEKIDFLRNSPHTRDLPAVARDEFFVLDYNEGISGPRNVNGLERFAKFLRSRER